jgi:hypothetical protein
MKTLDIFIVFLILILFSYSSIVIDTCFWYHDHADSENGQAQEPHISVPSLYMKKDQIDHIPDFSNETWGSSLGSIPAASLNEDTFTTKLLVHNQIIFQLV